MIISLIGYMGSGKSHISKILSTVKKIKLIDLDKAISEAQGKAISEIFEEKGEIYFRKLEKQTLENLLNSEENLVLSLGGGTPVYYDNMELINKHSKSVFLRTSVKTLSERLQKNKTKRPLISRISDEDLPEFIAKHLFERNLYYNQAHYIVDTDNKTPEAIVEEIIEKAG